MIYSVRKKDKLVDFKSILNDSVLDKFIKILHFAFGNTYYIENYYDKARESKLFIFCNIIFIF